MISLQAQLRMQIRNAELLERELALAHASMLESDVAGQRLVWAASRRAAEATGGLRLQLAELLSSAPGPAAGESRGVLYTNQSEPCRPAPANP